MNFKQYVYFRCTSWNAFKTALFQHHIERQHDYRINHPVEWFEKQEQVFLQANGFEPTPERYQIFNVPHGTSNQGVEVK
jgi:hypothetical protein